MRQLKHTHMLSDRCIRATKRTLFQRAISSCKCSVHNVDEGADTPWGAGLATACLVLTAVHVLKALYQVAFDLCCNVRRPAKQYSHPIVPAAEVPVVLPMKSYGGTTGDANLKGERGVAVVFDQAAHLLHAVCTDLIQ